MTGERQKAERDESPGRCNFRGLKSVHGEPE